MKVPLCTALALVAGCASNNKIDITDEEYDDIAISLGITARLDDGGGELPSLTNAITLARGGTVRNVVVDADDASLFHSTLDDDTYTYTFECRDPDGTEQSKCDATTASAEVFLNWSGTLPVPFLASVDSRIGSWTLADLRTPMVTVNGDAGIGFTTEYANKTRGVYASYDQRTGVLYSNLMYPIADDTVSAWPTSGTVTYDIEAKSKRERENVTNTRKIKLPAVLTFAADTGDHANLDLDASARIYDLELPSGSLVRTGGSEGDN